jgi:prepilin-type N-terminal cleavage/methylation domain-containing protein
MKLHDERGFTMAEFLVVILLVSIITIGFYQVMLSGDRGSDTSRSVVNVSEEARLGFNRLVRDTREASRFECASFGTPCMTPTSYTVHVNFDGDGVPENPNEDGDFELLTFSVSGNRILLNGETLIKGVQCVTDPVTGSCDVFRYASNSLEYDWNGNGVTSAQEINDAGPSKGVSVGDQDDPWQIDTLSELNHITSVLFSFEVTAGDRSTVFYAEAQLRNLR